MWALSLFRNFQNKRQNGTIFYSSHRTLTQPLHPSGKNPILSPAPKTQGSVSFILTTLLSDMAEGATNFWLVFNLSAFPLSI